MLAVEGKMIESRWGNNSRESVGEGEKAVQAIRRFRRGSLAKGVKVLQSDDEKSNGENRYAIFPLGCAPRWGALATMRQAEPAMKDVWRESVAKAVKALQSDNEKSNGENR
jgi:hypothetical protein